MSAGNYGSMGAIRTAPPALPLSHAGPPIFKIVVFIEYYKIYFKQKAVNSGIFKMFVTIIYTEDHK